MQWHMQGGNITINIKFVLDFTIPELIPMYVLTCKCRMDDSVKGIYDMIL